MHIPDSPPNAKSRCFFRNSGFFHCFIQHPPCRALPVLQAARRDYATTAPRCAAAASTPTFPRQFSP
ncbi:hypothetical protein, partial [Burkholderia anthinoferrum]|uniref:hypothetical protein n=1 Tax=Burkholderia anthinoferrum TaxID=3090833 RepID=UPI002B24AE8A